ncbi:MAG: fibronectin type III domain-containing protein [Planctomycetota bacterium]|nr:fibronectin type III domain-containing protein [Planctomycetota bacterium]
MFPSYLAPRLIYVLPDDPSLVGVVGMHPMELMYRLGCLGAGQTGIYLELYIPTNPPAQQWPEKTVPCNQTLPGPNAPSNLVATAVSSSQIDLTWTDNSDNEDGFIVECKTSCHQPFVQIATVGANTTDYSNIGLFPGTVYYYRVSAYNESCNSNYSNMSAAVTHAKIPTIEELIDLLNSYHDQLENSGIYNLLLLKLQSAQYSISIRDYQSALGQLGSFTNEIEAQTNIDHTIAELLIASANSLIEYLTFVSSIPTTFDMYLCPEPCPTEIIIQLPNGRVITTIVTGKLTIQLGLTANPDMASVTIQRGYYEGTPLIFNGIDSGKLYISHDPTKPSVGTLDLRTGEIELVETMLITSSYFDSIGISPFVFETSGKGTFYPLSLTRGDIYTISTGIIPSTIPYLGGAPFLAMAHKQC